jgi:hypothetical protein
MIRKVFYIINLNLIEKEINDDNKLEKKTTVNNNTNNNSNIIKTNITNKNYNKIKKAAAISTDRSNKTNEDKYNHSNDNSIINQSKTNKIIVTDSSLKATEENNEPENSNFNYI